MCLKYHVDIRTLAQHYSSAVTSYIILLFQVNHSDATKTQVAEPSHKWMGVTHLSRATIEEESTPSWNVPLLLWGLVSKSSLYNIKVGVLQVRELTWPTGSTDVPIDVRMAKEDLGRMMCMLYPVSEMSSLIFIVVDKKLKDNDLVQVWRILFCVIVWRVVVFLFKSFITCSIMVNPKKPVLLIS